MPLKNPYNSQIHSYLSLRNSLGWIGILLPFVLMLGMLLFFKGDIIRTTISQYYYSGMRDVLVGSICAIALFLFFYKGYNRFENWTANIAGFFALGIAWFPTSAVEPLDTIGKIHLFCASMFFIILSAFSIFFFTRKVPHPTKRKLKRNIIYVICGLVMIACLLAIVVYFNFIHIENSDSHFVFWAETVALIAFGISWLNK